MRAVSLFEGNYFLKAFFNTLLLVYDTFWGQKKFTFKLPGGCGPSFLVPQFAWMLLNIVHSHTRLEVTQNWAIPGACGIGIHGR